MDRLVQQSPEEQGRKVLVFCDQCRQPLGRCYVPFGTMHHGEGRVTLAGLGLFAPQTFERLEDGRRVYTCLQSTCRARFEIDAGDLGRLAIGAARGGLDGFRLPSSCRVRPITPSR